MKKILLILVAFLSISMCAQEVYQPHFSTAGFYPLSGTGRTVYSMNPAWRFYKGDVKGAEQPSFDDHSWHMVSLPNGIELLPSEASGCVNYQGIVWYRKHFQPDSSLKGKRLFLHFEGIMGKSKVWVNGHLMAEHFGGYLPVIIDITDVVSFSSDNVIAVMADNSNDPNYPPGKPQETLDFTYCGGIYRDCWLIVHHQVFITDPNYENVEAGGGLFVAYDHVSKESAMIHLSTHVRNMTSADFEGSVVYELYDKEGTQVLSLEHAASILSDSTTTVVDSVTIHHPHLWSPDSPYLYNLRVYVKDRNRQVIDGYYRRMGIRSIEFRGADGLWINGEPYQEPLIGANRHQDFAVIGNALSNSMHWRDAKKLKDTGMRIIRNAHYPQDPAFMDACDELGLFVIINTPGWQFWNKKPIFAQRVYNDIRQMVRRDRNHPSVFLWEPILNETWYPNDFARKVVEIINTEYPFPYCYYACDSFARGHELFPILFRHPLIKDKEGTDVPNDNKGEEEGYAPGVNYFTREWGDNVDNWSSHNSPSRVSRSWGEVPMLIQAQHYALPPYMYTCYDRLYRQPRQHFGGCLWHPFDHQRGYHPDPFYGGIMDGYRQPKLSYYMFESQRSPKSDSTMIAETGPMVYIANAMTPFSPNDVTVYSNCDEVRLTYCEGSEPLVYKKDLQAGGMPSPVITFKNVTDIMRDKKYSRAKKIDDYYLMAEGVIAGKVVARDTVYPARRATHVRLHVDNEGTRLVANGSDMVVVVASMTDDRGTVKRLNDEEIVFEISGPGTIVGDAQTFTNPKAIQWGTAPVIIRSTNTPGKITVRASVVWRGKMTPISGEITIETIPADHPYVATTEEMQVQERQISTSSHRMKEKETSNTQTSKVLERLKEVEKQQEDFENNH